MILDRNQKPQLTRSVETTYYVMQTTHGEDSPLYHCATFGDAMRKALAERDARHGIDLSIWTNVGVYVTAV